MSQINEKFDILLNNHLVKAIRTHARLILIPFFQKIAITSTENESGKSYPVLTTLAERIIYQVYENGELGYASAEKAKVIALAFIKKLNDWQKECLAFYFCTDDKLVEALEEEGSDTFLVDIPEEAWDKEKGKVITQTIHSMVSSEEQLASRIVNELVHLQDIFSTEDANSWDASSIDFANENFNSYTSSDIKLIPLSLDEFDYWNKIIGDPEVEDDEEDEEEDDD
ncbi:MAG: hypothetical protein IPL42_17450 [Saprospiraceae bacterium]|nr:hypothetical protein [Saprospiraceae bacterium]